jgi:hypothetical protein
VSRLQEPSAAEVQMATYPPASPRSTDSGPLLPAAPMERGITTAALVAGTGAAGWTWLAMATRGLDAVVRASVALPAFALGFGVVMLGMAVASDLRGRRR